MSAIKVSTFLLLLHGTSVYCSKYCDSQKECNDIKVDENLFCRGFQSCSYTSIESTTDLYCIGSNGCAYADSIKASNVYCYGDSGCANAVGNIEAVSGSVVCGGISSCYGINGDIIASQTITCGAAASCNSVTGNMIAESKIACQGTDSCRNVVGTISASYVGATGSDSAREAKLNIRDKGYFSGDSSGYGATITCGGNIQCDGPYSCATGTLSAMDDIRLFGYGSGYKSVITGTTVVYSHGYYSGAYSDIHATNTISKMTVQFYGHYSGYYANVWCSKVAVCIVSCKGTGCHFTEVYYQEDTDLIIEPTYCSKEINQGLEHNDVYCPTLRKYKDETETEFVIKRSTIRESTDKWTLLDDEYDYGQPGDAFQGDMNHMIMNKEFGIMLNESNNSSSSSLIVYFIIFASLLASLLTYLFIHWFCYRKNENMEIKPSLLYT